MRWIDQVMVQLLEQPQVPQRSPGSQRAPLANRVGVKTSVQLPPQVWSRASQQWTCWADQV